MPDALTTRCTQALRWRMQTCAAMLTPPGRGAVATVAVRGPLAMEFVARSFQAANNKPLSEQPIGRIVYGKWIHTESHEDVVVCRFDDRIEIHSHGGYAAPAAILDTLKSAGAAILTWQEWLWVTEPTPVQAIVAVGLAQAKTKLSSNVLRAQYNEILIGEFEQCVQLLKQRNKDELLVRLDRLIDSVDWGKHLLTPRRVILAGPPNSGKSSLLNALVGYERAIVFDQPGTTRDVVTAQASYNGWLLEFRDTAGLRSESDDQIEIAGMSRTVDELQTAETIVLVFDGSIPWNAESQALIDQHKTSGRESTVIVVLNKSDLNSVSADLEHASNDRFAIPNSLRLSAKERTNLDELFERILQQFIPTTIDPEQPILFEPELLAHVKKIREAVAETVPNFEAAETYMQMLI